jgi:hypothetical protein
MSTTIEPTLGRIVWYRGLDSETRPAIVTGVNGTFNVNLFVFGQHSEDDICGHMGHVTHADPDQEPGCYPSWHWMPYQIGQAKKHANGAARGDEPKFEGANFGGIQLQAAVDTSDTAIEREIQAKGKTAPRVTLDDLMANIHHVETIKHVTQSGQVLRWSVLVTQSGFAVAGKPSVAVSPENDDAEIGEQVAFENSRNELWPLMGYALKQDLHDLGL